MPSTPIAEINSRTYVKTPSGDAYYFVDTATSVCALHWRKPSSRFRSSLNTAFQSIWLLPFKNYYNAVSSYFANVRSDVFVHSSYSSMEPATEKIVSRSGLVS